MKSKKALALALVCARDLETLEQAKKLVRVVYEELPAVYGPEEASAPGAPEVIMGNRGNLQAHRHVVRGNADEAIKHSKYVLHEKFETPWTEHAFLEPECCVALPLENGGVKLLTTDQSAHTTQHECSAMLGVDFAHCQVENMLVGGGFGGKEDMSVQHHAALIAYIARVPVKVKLTRQESLLVHPKRHPMWMDFTMGCDENGIIQGVKAKVYSDTGAFASLGGPVLERACTHAAGPYNYQNFEIEGTAYYTNNPPAGAFRGFGVTQTCFATETLLNEMADKVGITPWEIRYRNAIRPGQELPNGQIVGPETGLVETLEAIKPYYDEAVKNGSFRQDLYYRLNVVNVNIPPLRERPDDIIVLAKHFAKKYSELNEIDLKPLSAGAEQKLLNYLWPGNVRELENTLHRAVLLSTGNEIGEDAVILDSQDAVINRNENGVMTGAEFVGNTVASVERNLIIDTLKHTMGNRTTAANILGISIRTLRNKLKQYQNEGFDIPEI